LCDLTQQESIRKECVSSLW